MRFSAEELNTVLQYVDTHAEDGVLLLGSNAAVARETGLRAGRVAALLYFLCGEGRILQEGNRILMLDDSPYSESAEV